MNFYFNKNITKFVFFLLFSYKEKLFWRSFNLNKKLLERFNSMANEMNELKNQNECLKNKNMQLEEGCRLLYQNRQMNINRLGEILQNINKQSIDIKIFNDIIELQALNYVESNTIYHKHLTGVIMELNELELGIKNINDQDEIKNEIINEIINLRDLQKKCNHVLDKDRINFFKLKYKIRKLQLRISQINQMQHSNIFENSSSKELKQLED